MSMSMAVGVGCGRLTAVCLQAEKTSEITVLQAEAQAQALLADVTAKATALNITIQGEVDAMLHIKSCVVMPVPCLPGVA